MYTQVFTRHKEPKQAMSWFLICNGRGWGRGCYWSKPMEPKKDQ